MSQLKPQEIVRLGDIQMANHLQAFGDSLRI